LLKGVAKYPWTDLNLRSNGRQACIHKTTSPDKGRYLISRLKQVLLNRRELVTGFYRVRQGISDFGADAPPALAPVVDLVRRLDAPEIRG